MTDNLKQAVANLIKVKGRFHTEQAYKQLVDAYDEACRTEPAGSAEPVHVRADVRANDIDDRYAGRLAILLECMLLDSNWYWSEAANLLDEYKAEWDKVNPQPPLFMAEPMPPERKALLLALKAERGSK